MPISPTAAAIDKEISQRLESSWIAVRAVSAIFGVPCSAMSISLRPNAAWLMFLTQKSLSPFEVCCDFSRGDSSSSSDELPVYEAAVVQINQLTKN